MNIINKSEKVGRRRKNICVKGKEKRCAAQMGNFSCVVGNVVVEDGDEEEGNVERVNRMKNLISDVKMCVACGRLLIQSF
jgi:putative ribosome biogenesis GTPase RsgA